MQQIDDLQAELNITHAEASAAILAACDEGRLVQGQWHDRDDEGREIACLLGAIHPKVLEAADCNGDLMPMWLAEMTPILFDGIPESDIFPIARRYGELVARWHVLSEAQWDAIRTRVLIRCIDDAVAAARPVCEGWVPAEGLAEEARRSGSGRWRDGGDAMSLRDYRRVSGGMGAAA